MRGKKLLDERMGDSLNRSLDAYSKMFLPYINERNNLGKLLNHVITSNFIQLLSLATGFSTLFK
jgi:hypothetical protein